MGFGGTGQQQDLLCIIVGHKATLRTYLLAQAAHKGGEFMEMCATQCFSMEKSRWAALGAFKLGDGGVTQRVVAEVSRGFKPFMCSSGALGVWGGSHRAPARNGFTGTS